ncbi:major facilitator superfamily-domain-containing protein [Apiospora arundinis]
MSDSDTPVAPYEVSPRPIHGWKWAIGSISILSVAFLFALDNTIVAAIQPSILESLGEVQLLAWIGVASRPISKRSFSSS